MDLSVSVGSQLKKLTAITCSACLSCETAPLPRVIVPTYLGVTFVSQLVFPYRAVPTNAGPQANTHSRWSQDVL